MFWLPLLTIALALEQSPPRSGTAVFGEIRRVQRTPCIIYLDDLDNNRKRKLFCAGDMRVYVPGESSGPVPELKPAPGGTLKPGTSVLVLIDESDGKPVAQSLLAGASKWLRENAAAIAAGSFKFSVADVK
jgi:hypothetical protein